MRNGEEGVLFRRSERVRRAKWRGTWKLWSPIAGGPNKVVRLDGVKMQTGDRLARLEELLRQREVARGFPSRQACLEWANQVAPLLKFNSLYYETFLRYLQIITSPVSTYAVEPAFRNMLNQVQMAIAELKLEASSPSKVEGPVPASPIKGSSVLKLEPSIYGMGIKLPELCQWVKGRWKAWRKGGG